MSDRPTDLPPSTWPSRAEMMRARADVLPNLERAAASWRRVLAGAGSTALAFAGALLGGSAVDYIARYGADDQTAVAIVVAVVLLAAGTVFGALVWRAGRRVVNALIAWEELPDRVPPDDSRVAPELREAVDADTMAELTQRRRVQRVDNRARLFTPPRAARLGLGALPLLVGVAAILYAVVGPGRDEGTATALAAGAVLVAAGAVVSGGQLRFGWCLTRRDWRLRKDHRSRASQLGVPNW